MLDFEDYRELRNGKRYNTSIERTLSENGNIEEKVTGISSENVKGETCKRQRLTQKVVNEQFKGCIVSLTRQLEELNRLVQGNGTTPHRSHYPRTDFGTISGTAAYLSDIWCLRRRHGFKRLAFSIRRIQQWKSFRHGHEKSSGSCCVVEPHQSSRHRWKGRTVQQKNRPVNTSQEFAMEFPQDLVMLKDKVRYSENKWVITAPPLVWLALSCRSSGPEFCVVWLVKMPVSGWNLLCQSVSFVPWLILNAFRDVSGAVPEWPWFSGFMRKSSRCANAPSMRFFDLLNSHDSFFVTLPSISSETWVM